MTVLKGEGVSKGVVFGKIRFFRRVAAHVEKRLVTDVQAEVKRFEDARAAAVAQLANLYVKTRDELGEENSLLFQIHQMMLEDVDYGDSILNKIKNDKVCAEYAVSETSKEFAEMFSQMEDEYMRGRAADVKDVSARVIAILTGQQTEEDGGSEPCVLAADELAPSETAQLDKSKVLAFVTSGGSYNSHTAIFARTMGIPAVIGLKDQLTKEINGKEVIVDGSTGCIYLDADEATRKEMNDKHQQEEARKRLLSLYRGRPTVTKSGHHIELCANIGNPKDMSAVLENDAEGIGLFRSEFLYLESSDYPTEEQQFAAYKTVAEKMKGKRVVIRTLDIGADKQAAYFNLPKEENPAMGMRAIRICLTRPEIFKTQLRALYRASAYGKIAIMFPMITSVEEVQQCKQIAAQVREELTSEGVPFSSSVELGIMVETPAAAIISDDLAKEVDFFSVGTNDLTQYTLACDRQNLEISRFCNTHHKAILRLIRTAAENAHKAGIWIGICGELGADETLTQTFVDMGIDELSVTPASILGLRAAISEIE
ncbi:MAG: phosphoenolpyruvate--protein phosphotransferase [Oscillospiraceae bacterium]|nr:phosphoenolpyruvate--protein phosphotransferase [Oscillospiraceae bacterium]